MTKQTEPLEILVVDDLAENRNAAKEYFSTLGNVKVDFAESYIEGLAKLQENVYAAAIFDLELPKLEGGKPEKLGFELAKEAAKYAVVGKTFSFLL